MKRKLSMDVVNPHAANIDIGSKNHFVSVGQQPEEVREFGVYTHDHDEMTSWLQGYGITSVTMESTGDYRGQPRGRLYLVSFKLLVLKYY